MSTFIGIGANQKIAPKKDTEAIVNLTKQVEELTTQNEAFNNEKESLEIRISELTELNETLVTEKTELETLNSELTKQVEELTKANKKNKTE